MALGLELPGRFGFWCGFLIALARLAKRGRLLTPDEDDANE
jgi:hypothetical protein